MTSKERTKRAIHFKGVDHIPHFLPDGLENDIIEICADLSEINDTWKKIDTDLWEYKSLFGSIYRRIGNTSGEVFKIALEEWKEFDSYKLPDLNKPRYFNGAIEEMRQNPDKYFLASMPFCSLFAGAHEIRGFSNTLTDFYENPEYLCRLLDNLVEKQLESVDLVSQIGADGIMGYDDWGLQDRPIIGMNLWDEFFKPRYKKVWDYAHSKNLDVWLHSCGHIVPILKSMIDIGLNVIQMDQQEHIGLDLLGREFGGKVTFWCPVDIQNTMVYGNVDEIKEYVKKMIFHLGRYDGGFISKFYPNPDSINISNEKIMTMSSAFREYGIYE